ncbi:response regulator [Anaerolineales bacterium HSG24]|nr:response regulator [Anaerolineales bacterium HSG24]
MTTILIVDDEPNNLDVLRNYLFEANFKILVAINGTACLKLVDRIKPDLILLDINMNGIDGFETCRRLKKKETTKDTPVIFVTAKTETIDKVKGFEIGAVDYITKPFQPKEVMARVNKHLTIHNLQKQLEKKNRQLETEIAERKQAEQIIKQQNQFFHTVIESLGTPFYVINVEDYTIEIANSAARELGITPMNTCYAITHGRDTPCDSLEHPCPLTMVCETKKWITVEHLHRDKDGNHIQIEVHGHPIFNDEGDVVQIIEHSIDITERKRAEEAMKQAKEAAEAANQAKSSFLSNITHELRTPLNGILGYAQILKQESNLTTLQLDGLNIIHDSGQHLLTLINDVLDIAKIEAGKLDIYPEPLNLPNLLDGVVSIIRMAAQQKKIKFIYDAPHDLPMIVEADEKRLRQILLNLLSNAIKFTKEGKVTLRVVNMRMAHDDDARSHLRFEIIDTGIGITTDQLTKIFTPFEQVGDDEYKQKGTGLGLSITHQLVSLMGGELQVESEVGQGSNFGFDITVPKLDKTTSLEEKRRKQRRIVGYQGQRRHVLVVDDRAENRLALQKLLEPIGFDVTVVTNGQEGVEQAQAIQPDLILMDLVMPIKTGFEAVKEIRAMPTIKDTPIIAISTSDLDKEKSHIMGFDAFLSKPIKTDELFNLIEKYMALNWVCDEMVSALPMTQPVMETEITPPPQSELEQLYELTMYGNMERVEEKTRQLEEVDAGYASFAKKVYDYAHNFEDELILELLEQFMEHGLPP